MSKLMAFDVDGTILFDQKISSQNLDALWRWHDAGNITVCNTGRSMEAVIQGLQEYSLPFDYYVLYTGAVIADSERKVLDARSLPQQAAREIIQHFQDISGVSVYATSLEQDFSLNREQSDATIVSHFKPVELASIEDIELVVVPLLIDDPELRKTAYEWILGNYGDLIDCQRNSYILDVVPKGSTKGTGLGRLMDNYLHISPEDCAVYTIGDSWNDIPMHQFAHVAASFPYSPPEVQAATTHVVDQAYEFVDLALVKEKPKN